MIQQSTVDLKLISKLYLFFIKMSYMCFIYIANPMAGYQAPVAWSVRASYL